MKYCCASFTGGQNNVIVSSYVQAEIPNELAQGKAFIQGRDRLGRALIIVQCRRHFYHDTQECERYIMYCIDAAIHLADPEQNPGGWFLCILNLTGTLIVLITVGDE
jgi:hypothetical protein